MLGENFVKAQLALTAWRDGKSEGLSGCLAVMFTIRNRIRAGWFNGDWIQVLAHHQDYAAVDRPYSSELPDPRNYLFSLVLQEVDGVFSGSREDDVTKVANPVSNSTFRFQGQDSTPVPLYYARLDDPQIKESFLQNISQNHEQHKLVAQVGLLHFFS